jgi:hypothetical protein
MIYLGDRMGLYRTMHGAGALTSEELARKTGLHERWVREWCFSISQFVDPISQGFGRVAGLVQITKRFLAA